MSWLSILGVVVIVVALLSVLGLGPKGGRPAGRTRLMSVARIVLVLVGLILLFFAYKG